MSAKPWVILPLVLPVGEKSYTVAPVDYDAGLELLDVLQGRHKRIKVTSPNDALFKLVMGDTWDAMLADKLPFPVVFRAGMAAAKYQTMLVNDQSSEDAVAAAEQMWESGIDPKALLAALEQANRLAGSTTSPGTAAAKSSTKRPANTSGTTSRRARAKQGSRSNSTTSSPSGP